MLEGLLAGVVLAISAATLSLGMSQGLRSLQDARDQQQAAALLDEVLTRIDIIGPQAIHLDGPRSGTFPAPHEKFSWEATIRSTASLDLFEVTAKVTWPAGDAIQSAEAVTLLNDPLGSRPTRLSWEDL